LASAEAFGQATRQMADFFRDKKIDVIAAAEARGFLFAGPMSLDLGVSLVPIRKPGKLPYETLSYTYELEYGTDTLEIHTDAIPQGANVLVVDDLLATGGTVEACCKMVEKAGGKVAGCAFVVELTGLGGRKRIADYPLLSLIKYD
jgi:adenine phosphoribosyltransferase